MSKGAAKSEVASSVIDRSMFYGSKMPDEVAKSLSLLRSTDKTLLRKLIQGSFLFSFSFFFFLFSFFFVFLFSSFFFFISSFFLFLFSLLYFFLFLLLISLQPLVRQLWWRNIKDCSWKSINRSRCKTLLR